MQEQHSGINDPEHIVRPFARINARVVPTEEIERFGYIEGLKVGYLTTTSHEPEIG